MSAVLDLPGIRIHGRSELAAAERGLASHQLAGCGLCSCGRPWPCPERGVWATYQRYWLLRLSLLEATEPLEVVGG